MVKMGRTAAQHEAARGSHDDGDVWIKNFRDGETRVRILQSTARWTTYAEHYSEDIGFFPCTEERDCVGCNDDSERVRKLSRRYAFNAIDENGRVNVYKVGTKLHRTFEGREQRDPNGTIVDRDFLVIRSGKGLETSYDLDPLERYPLENMPEGLHNVPLLVFDKYDHAHRAYTGDGWADLKAAYEAVGQSVEAPQRMLPLAPYDEAMVRGMKVSEEFRAAYQGFTGNTPPTPYEFVDGVAVLVDPATGALADVLAAAVKDPWALPAEAKPIPKFTEMQTPELRKWLADHGVEVPATAARKRLIDLANTYADANPGF